MKTIILAGGCFWGVDHFFSKLKGVTKTTSGYIDGKTKDPTYKDVIFGSGHAEAVRVQFDEKRVTLEKILELFFEIIEPTREDGQGNDIGIQYRTGIYYLEDDDLPMIEDVYQSVQTKYDKPLSTSIKKAGKFYPAESYHQNYLDKNPGGYCHVDMSILKGDKEQ